MFLHFVLTLRFSCRAVNNLAAQPRFFLTTNEPSVSLWSAGSRLLVIMPFGLKAGEAADGFYSPC